MWYRGKVNPYWDDSYKKFNYVNQPITNKELIEWERMGYTHTSVTGKMYDSTNPMPKWVEEVANEIGLTKCGYVFYNMKTLDIMPVHVDHFNRYCEVFNVERKNVWRAIVFLEDWKSGHYFEIDGTPIIDYRKGDFILWSCDTPHSASNIGIQNRYTLQITGLLDQ